ncbi:hypothetical protein P3T43_006694 [Paraburkholderia sp. GAS41]|uniref:hypothetical protein n=1 Tax=Paraburkholderia sp. GAS41 TaxID=3035134 RepID=UPI003D1ED0EF
MSARCARIIAHGINLGRVEQARVFVFDTSFDVDTAIAKLDAAYAVAAAPRSPTLTERMVGGKRPR